MALVERAESELPLSQQADLLSLSRALEVAAEVQLKHRIDEIYTQYPFDGARKIAAQMQREGMGINRKTVGRYMSEMGIAAIYPGPRSLVDGTTRKASIPTYCVTSAVRIPIIFGASISLTFASTRAGCTQVGHPGLVLALRGKPGNSIRRWSYPLCSPSSDGPCDKRCRRFAIAIKAVILPTHSTVSCCRRPMSRSAWMAKGEPWTIFLQKGCGVRRKYEEVYLHDYTSPREARQALTGYFEFYNQERPHQALDYRTPAEVYFHSAAGNDEPVLVVNND